MRIWVVNNGSQWTHREWRVLRYLKQDTKIVENDTSLAELRAANLDGLVLSGGAAEPAVDGKLGAVSDYLDGLDIPMLGVCAAHQYMAHHFGGKLIPGRSPEFGRTEITITDPDEILRGIPSPTIVWANHNDDIAELPRDFKVLASSPTCGVQVMRHKTRPLFGTAFHPEVEHTVHGVDIFRNFVRICEEHAARKGTSSPRLSAPSPSTAS